MRQKLTNFFVLSIVALLWLTFMIGPAAIHYARDVVVAVIRLLGG